MIIRKKSSLDVFKSKPQNERSIGSHEFMTSDRPSYLNREMHAYQAWFPVMEATGRGNTWIKKQKYF